MALTRSDVVREALRVLDTYGLADLTMRRLAGELGVQASALYHHVANKQTLLAAVADEVLVRGARPLPPGAWDAEVLAVAGTLRDAMLAYRDGAELVSTVIAFGLGAEQPLDDLVAALTRSDLAPDLVPVAARTVLHFVLGHTLEEQTRLQAGAAGAVDSDLRPSDFAVGLGIVVDGVRARAAEGLAGASQTSR